MEQDTALPLPHRPSSGALYPLPGALARLRRTSAIAIELTKARLVSLVLLTTAVGFVLGADAATSWDLLVAALLGTGFTAAGSMILNELAERSRDSRMLRTQRRPLPAGEVTPAAALSFGTLAVGTGLAILLLFVNQLTALLGLTVVLLYVLVYTPLKPRSTTCTLVGAVCGAIPPMMGWSAATGTLGFGAWLLAAVLFFWQIPHFLALAWLYRADYERGGFKVLPVLDPSGRTTTTLANLYIVALLPLGAVAALSGVSGWSAAAGSFVLGAALLAAGLHLANSRSDRSARRLFLATLVYLPLVLGLMVADRPPRSDLAGISASAASPTTDRDTLAAPVTLSDTL